MINSVEHKNDVISALTWRYATKQFDSAKKIDAAIWSQLEQSLQLTPSSYGLQPWKFVVVTNSTIKQELVNYSWSQPQPGDCSHLVVIARLQKLSENYIRNYATSIAGARAQSQEDIQPYLDMMLGFQKRTSEEKLADWMSRQCYIALGNLMTTASLLGVDNCPMEGFDREKYDEVLQLGKFDITSVVACALGYRHEDDKYGKVKKVRHELKDLIVKI